ncbi:MAG TPA: NgoMIV family type II restriction endonuclease [Jatrophihabitantaceae bacterium]
MGAPRWFVEKLGWKKATSGKPSENCQQLFGVRFGPNLADLGGKGSASVSGLLYARLGIPKERTTDLDIEKAAAEAERAGSAGTGLEVDLENDLRQYLAMHAPGRGFEVTRTGTVAQFSQYSHLNELQKLFNEQPTLRSAIGRDYHVKTDVMVSLPDPADPEMPRFLHAAVSSKLTLRSDRAQNIRYEFGTLVANRRGRLPHLVVVTAEPLPSRLVSLARGTGAIDAVYHLLYEEMDSVMRAERIDHYGEHYWLEQQRDWQELVTQGRIRPYAELPALLATG